MYNNTPKLYIPIIKRDLTISILYKHTVLKRFKKYKYYIKKKIFAENVVENITYIIKLVN